MNVQSAPAQASASLICSVSLTYLNAQAALWKFTLFYGTHCILWETSAGTGRKLQFNTKIKKELKMKPFYLCFVMC